MTNNFPNKRCHLIARSKGMPNTHTHMALLDAGSTTRKHSVPASWPSVLAIRYLPFHCLFATKQARPMMTAKRNISSPTSKSTAHARALSSLLQYPAHSFQHTRRGALSLFLFLVAPLREDDVEEVVPFKILGVPNLFCNKL